MANEKETTSNTSKFGWCMDGHHTMCLAEFASSLTKKDYVCPCECHQTRK